MERFLYCFSAKLTEVIVLTVKEGETVFKQSNWGGNMSSKDTLPSLLPTFSCSSHAETQAEGEGSYIKTSCPFPFSTSVSHADGRI